MFNILVTTPSIGIRGTVYLLNKINLHDDAGFNTVWKNTEYFFIQNNVLCWMVDANGDVLGKILEAMLALTN